MSDVVMSEAAGRVLTVTINRPEARDAINRDVAQGLRAGQADQRSRT
jgi:enoyl-CoA hydratase